MVTEIIVKAAGQAVKAGETKHGRCEHCGRMAKLQKVDCSIDYTWLRHSWLLRFLLRMNKQRWKWLCPECVFRVKLSRFLPKGPAEVLR